MKRQLRTMFLCGLFVFTGVVNVAQAGPIYTGTGWGVPIGTSSNVPTEAGMPGPDAQKWVEFTTSALDFSGSCPFCYNIGDFLNSSGALLSATYFNFADAGTALDSTLWQFTGTALFTNGETYSVRHDDGVRLYVGGVAVLESPAATSAVTDTFTYLGSTGNQSFNFLYANAFPAQAEFQLALTPAQDVPVPEPATLTLLGTGLLAVVRARRRRT